MEMYSVLVIELIASTWLTFWLLIICNMHW